MRMSQILVNLSSLCNNITLAIYNCAVETSCMRQIVMIFFLGWWELGIISYYSTFFSKQLYVLSKFVMIFYYCLLLVALYEKKAGTD